jgi:ribosomal protein S18 acetylase RimI-like enzyme
MSSGFEIVRGLHGDHAREAVALLYEAFEVKVLNELRPRSRQQAERVFLASMEPERALAAIDGDGSVLGVAGIGRKGAPFMELRLGLLVREFGLGGGLWRRAYSLVEALAAPISKDVSRIEVLAVRADSRGVGVGRALLEAAVAAAAEVGARAITLEVVDTNGRARDLYERVGFEHVRTTAAVLSHPAAAIRPSTSCGAPCASRYR